VTDLATAQHAPEQVGARVSTAPATPAPGLGARIAPLAIVAMALVPRVATAGHFETTDEFTWTLRSRLFWNAVQQHDFDHATAALGPHHGTMPGVTTMWLGALARGLSNVGGWAHDSLHITALGRGNGLQISQYCVAVTCALLVGVIVVLARRWAGPIPAYTAGVILATEPFVVAHGAVFHTDELTAFLGAAGALAFLLALDVPAPFNGTRDARTSRAPHDGIAIAAGLLLGLSALTKVSAAEFLPGMLAVALYALWRARRDTDDVDAVGAVLRTIGVVVAVALVTFVVLWPALWTDTLHQLSLLPKAGELAQEGHVTFFRGRIVDTPGPSYYVYAFPLRMTPWFFVALPIATVTALVVRATRARAATLLTFLVPVVVIISFASKQIDRYVLALVPFCALLVGLMLERVAAVARARIGRRAITATGATLAAASLAYSLTVVPWGLAYFNPVVGGGDRALKTVLVGWGEGMEQMYGYIRRREHGRCDSLSTIAPNMVEGEYGCGTLVEVGSPEAATADYAIVYVADWQRWRGSEAANWTRVLRRMHPVYRLYVRGMVYGDVFARR
jgi:hypothetical protein